MSSKLRVGLLFGGRSAEHDVSVVSARSVLSALDPTKYEVIPIGITRDGHWLLDADLQRGLSDQLHLASAVQTAALTLGPSSTLTDENEKQRVENNQSPGSFDVVFPVLHGPNGEDGSIQGFLQLADVPYVGCDVLSSALGMDKIVQKRLFQQAGLPIVDYVSCRRREWRDSPEESIADIEAALPYPLFAKPAALGSSIGISKAHNRAELAVALDTAARYGPRIIVEAAVANVREIEFSVLGNDDPRVSVPGEIVAAHEFYDYKAKYEADSALHVPAQLSQDLTSELQELAIRAFQTLECCGMARVDFLLDSTSDEIYVNEINTIPGFTPISMYPKLWEASGLAYPALLDELIRLAQERFQEASEQDTAR
jgi:D-alanine-D-alanine ligase